jgi:hypothetical protein
VLLVQEIQYTKITANMIFTCTTSYTDFHQRYIAVVKVLLDIDVLADKTMMDMIDMGVLVPMMVPAQNTQSQ